jgi:inorganic pyrophosphatase
MADATALLLPEESYPEEVGEFVFYGPVAGCGMSSTNLADLECWDSKSGTLNVIIETTKGSRSKIDYNPEQRLFELSKILPRGMIFPFDFGFIPSTLGDDGDPLDVLVLMCDAVPAGCKIPARLIGVIEAEQVEDGERERNDRLIAVGHHCHEHRDVHTISDLGGRVLDEIEHFFVAYNELEGKQFTPIARRGPHHSEVLMLEPPSTLPIVLAKAFWREFSVAMPRVVASIWNW